MTCPWCGSMLQLIRDGMIARTIAPAFNVNGQQLRHAWLLRPYLACSTCRVLQRRHQENRLMSGRYRVWVLWPDKGDQWSLEVPTFRTKADARGYVRDMRRREPAIPREVRVWTFNEETGLHHFVKV